MKEQLEQEIIHLSGVLVIPNSMPECLKILEIKAIPILNRYLVKESGIIIQGYLENTIDYEANNPINPIEKNQKYKSKIHFARFLEIKNLKIYSRINLRAYLEWKEFSLTNPRNIQFLQIVSVNPTFTLKSKD